MNEKTADAIKRIEYFANKNDYASVVDELKNLNAIVNKTQAPAQVTPAQIQAIFDRKLNEYKSVLTNKVYPLAQRSLISGLMFSVSMFIPDANYDFNQGYKNKGVQIAYNV